MTITKLALTSALTAAPIGAAANVDAGPIVAGPTSPSAIDAAPGPDGPISGPVAVLPQAALGGGANPSVPNGTDPFVPFGVWTP